MDNRRNYYRILQVQPDAPFEIIRTSYLTLLHKLKQHPDLGGDHWNAKVLNEAFQTLSDEKKRAEYDRKLFQHYKKTFYSKERVRAFCTFCKRPLTREDHSDKNCVCHNNLFQTENLNSTRESCKRSLIRTQKLEKFHFITSASERLYEATMVDLSPKGIRFLCRKVLDTQEIIKIDSSLFRAIAEVISSKKIVKNGKSFFSIGAHFQSITFTHQEGTFLSASL
ncbi:MAG: DnaJ domain-containing protein [Candidatus Scalindua sp.]|nr:DnaJ domain-containing protein [Candidatus Scalindua sp.]